MLGFISSGLELKQSRCCAILLSICAILSSVLVRLAACALPTICLSNMTIYIVCCGAYRPVSSNLRLYEASLSRQCPILSYGTPRRLLIHSEGALTYTELIQPTLQQQGTTAVAHNPKYKAAEAALC